ncbi:FG-GAP-like repeat-containing protein [Streptomyces sp. NPDC048332]|uniref:FG-GAP-like repeat-containing protein n=1 Tax=Streptomyces sp. NPDC048332 TaxID=3154619 RepID=UPI00344A08AF
MRSPHSKRALTLASALVAAGLALSSAPHALAADHGSSVMKLTDAQATKLADHLNVDVYGDQAETTGDNTSDAGASTDAAAGAAKSGSGSKLDAAADASTPVTFTNKSTLEGVRGIAATVPAQGSQYFTVHSLGNVQLHKADGSTVWARTNTSLYGDWQVKPLRVYQTEAYPAHILMGYNAVSPLSPYSDQGYSTGDLTGDGVPDLVFSASVGSAPYRPFTSPGSDLTTGTFVTVLDGKTGKTVWSKLYSYATMVKIVDGTLLVADTPRFNQNSPATQTATLTGIRFSYADGALTPSSTWTYDTGETRTASWGALEDLGGGKAAVSWNLARDNGVAAHGNTLVLDTSDGSVVWKNDNELYNRQLHLDAARGHVVALEQSDVNDAIKYEIATYDLKTGERTTLDTRVNAMPTAMTVGDAATGGGTEYVVSESTFDSNYNVNASTIRVLSGKDGSTVDWTYTVKRDAENQGNGASIWNLDTVGGQLVAAGQDDRSIYKAANVGGNQYGALTVFNAKGKVDWQQKGLAASPMYQQLYKSGGNQFVRTVDQNQNIHDYKFGNGKQKSITPLQADLSYAKAVDLDGDKKPDVVAGGNSSGVWAYSGKSLLTGTPKKLWQATVPGSVHSIATGDVNGDGKPEIVVAADTATVVLDGANGNVLTTIDGGGKYVRSVTVADVNADGKDEILVPTDALRVYNARGTQLWSYNAPAGTDEVVFSDTVVSDGRVYTSYSTLNGLDTKAATVNGVALDGKGAVQWTADPQAPGSALDGKLLGTELSQGIFASPNIPYADGHAVVYTWITMAEPNADSGTDVPIPKIVIEVRDGRTGKVVYQRYGGSPWSHGNYFIDGKNDPLYQLSFGVMQGMQGVGIEDSYASVVAPLRSVQFINGPAGRKLLAGGVEGGLAAYDPSILTTGWSFQAANGTANAAGGRNYLAADLDGDGTDEMLSLNFDDFGVNRTAEQLGGGVLSLNNAIHQMSTFKLS